MCVPLPEVRILLRNLRRHRAVAPLHVEPDRSVLKTVQAGEIADLLQRKLAVDSGLPLRMREVLDQSGCLEMRIHARLKVEARQLRHVAAQLHLHVQPRLHLGLRHHARAQIGKIDRDAVAIARGDVVHLCVEILRCGIKRNRAIVYDCEPIRQLNLAGLQIEQCVLHRFGARARVLGNGLIRVAVLVDDQVKVRLFHTQIVQRNMRLRTFADRVRQEGVDAQTQEDLRGREVRHLTWTFGAVDHQIVRLNGEMPQIE